MRGSEGETDRLFGLDDAALTLLREARLGATLDRIFAAHPHYRRTFVAAGIRRSDIATLSDIASLPVTTKADYMADPASFRLGPDGARFRGPAWPRRRGYCRPPRHAARARTRRADSASAETD